MPSAPQTLPCFKTRSPLGSVAPDALSFKVKCPNGISGLNVASVVFSVTAPVNECGDEPKYQQPRDLPRPTTATWAGTVAAATVGSVTLNHPYVATDLQQLGTYRGYATITMADSTTWMTTSFEIECFDPFENPLPSTPCC